MKYKSINFITNYLYEIIIKDAIKYKPKTIWLQLGITSVNGNKFAKTINANYIQNSCIKTEYERIMLN